ncbi:hypothetical protein BC829DRAFT_48110 [Chytridium lagenaria]|nr:hypothetical protein BC829DRAFT_48110 [Chytridium lagenaria]
MRVSATTYANGALAGALIAIIVAAIIAILVTKNVARRVLVPVEELTDWLSGVASSNMDTEVADAPVTSHELRVVKQNFQNLLIAIRFGNDAYYAGDLSKALANYEAAEELMIQLSNERGRGVCLNNKGNVFMQMDEGQIGRAVEAYNKAIDIAETLLEGEMDPHHKTTIQITLANRISNLGVVYKDSEQSPSQNLQSPIPFTPKQEKANHFFKRSLDLHRGCDNLEGIAQVSGNLGQLHLDAGKIVEASELIRDAYDIVKDRSDPIAMQYACMNMGLLAIHIGKPAEAVTWFTYVLQRFDVVVNLVQRTCAMEIVRLCEETDPAIGVNQPELARAIREVAVPVLGDIFSSGGVAKPKDLHFVSTALVLWLETSYVRADLRSSLSFVKTAA